MKFLNAKSAASEFGKVGVLFGGRSAEREVSLMSGKGVLEALRSKGIDAHGFDTGERSLAELAQQGFDRVFVALHGRFGEDGTLQGALEMLGIPYTGSGVMASAIGMDKIYTKRIWQSHQLPTPRYHVINGASDLAGAPQQLGLPLILKPPHEGSTIGITKVTSSEQMQQAYAEAARFDAVVLAEEFVQGRELTVAVLGRGQAAYALPIVEIVAPGGNYDYQNKYFTDDTRYFCPPALPAELQKHISDLAVEAYRALGCEGWARVDLLLRDADQTPFLLEVNTSPGMTGHSLVPIAARAVGIDYADLCVSILAEASLKMAAGHTGAQG